jgi:hypothetical protein
MANQDSANITQRNRWVSVGWVVGIAAAIITCLVLQQSALLYVLSTLSITVLLVIVARADLKGDTKSSDEL